MGYVGRGTCLPIPMIRAKQFHHNQELEGEKLSDLRLDPPYIQL